MMNTNKKTNSRTNSKTDAARKAATEKRLAAMRANLTTLENTAAAILAKGPANLTEQDRRNLLHIVNIAFHESGKIEGIWSIDSTAACDFCARMIKAAADNILMICGSCYAAADAWKEAAWRRHQLNARILSTVLFPAAELAALAIGDLCRFNEDGDTVNVTMARNYIRIILTHQATRFGYWYKNAPAVEAGLHAEGITSREQLPDNARFIHSSALIGFPARATWFDDAIFTVYPDEKTTLAAVAAGAHECNGRKCRGAACGAFCYVMARRPADPVHVAEVLRCNASRRAAILAAYETRKAQEIAAAGRLA